MLCCAVIGFGLFEGSAGLAVLVGLFVLVLVLGCEVFLSVIGVVVVAVAWPLSPLPRPDDGRFRTAVVGRLSVADSGRASRTELSKF